MLFLVGEKLSMKCPTCKKDRSRFDTEAHLPFCSERCKQADFGRWLEGEYKISRPLKMEDEVLMEDIPIEGEDPEEGIRNE